MILTKFVCDDSITESIEPPHRQKTGLFLCENKGAGQLRSNCEADQRLCFRHTDSTVPPLCKSKTSSFYKAVVGGPAGPAMAGPLFRPKMVSAGPQFSIIRPKMC